MHYRRKPPCASEQLVSNAETHLHAEMSAAMTEYSYAVVSHIILDCNQAIGLFRVNNSERVTSDVFGSLELCGCTYSEFPRLTVC